MLQASDEESAIEMNIIGEADIKGDSEEFCNDDQPNYDGMKWIIIRLSTILMLYRFYFIVTFVICFMTIFLFPSKMNHFIQRFLYVFFLLPQKKWHLSMMKLM